MEPLRGTPVFPGKGDVTAMRTIGHYILRHLTLATLSVTAALTLAVWLSQSLRFMDFIVNRGLPAGDFLTFVLLLLPGFLGLVLPVALFGSVLFVYNRLAGESELVVLRAAGVAPWRIARPALLLALAVTAVGYAISLYLLPVSYRAFKDFQFEIRHDYAALVLEEGRFNRVSEDLTIYVRTRTQDGTLRGLLVHDRRENDGEGVTMMARRGALVRAETGPRVVLSEGNRQQRDPESGRLSMLYFDRYTLDLGALGSPARTRWRQPRERFLGRLLTPGPGPDDQRFANELIAEGHRRLAAPLYALAFTGVALVTVLGGPFDRRGRQRRLLGAVLTVALLQAAQVALSEISVRHPAALPLVHALPLAALGASLLALILPRRPGGGSTPRRTRLLSTAEAQP